MTRLLIVDDDIHLRKLVQTYAETSGYTCDEASSGDAALKKLLSSSCDLIILDVMMPGEDGFKILEKIRETKDIPVIMLTARNEEYDRLLGFRLGADDYVPKPFSPRELMARVGAVLKRVNRKKGRCILLRFPYHHAKRADRSPRRKAPYSFPQGIRPAPCTRGERAHCHEPGKAAAECLGLQLLRRRPDRGHAHHFAPGAPRKLQKIHRNRMGSRIQI
jgi:DNA-binding response OmpR family regulator